MPEEAIDKPTTLGVDLKSSAPDVELKSWDKSSTKPVISNQFVNLYSNSVSMGFSNWDMWMIFSEMFGEDEEGKMIVSQKARVTMSLQHAKAFLKVLQTNLEAFEKQFGEIQILGSAKELFEDSK